MTNLRSNSIRWKPLFRTSAVKVSNPLASEVFETGSSSKLIESPRADTLNSSEVLDTFPVLVCPWEVSPRPHAAPVIKKDGGILKKSKTKSRKSVKTSEVSVRWPLNVVEQSINPVLWCDECSDTSGSDSYKRSVNRKSTGRWKEASPINVDMPHVPVGSGTQEEDNASVFSEEPVLEPDSDSFVGSDEDSFGGSEDSEDEFCEKVAKENAAFNKANMADPTPCPPQEGESEEAEGQSDESEAEDVPKTHEDELSGFGDTSDEEEKLLTRQRSESRDSEAPSEACGKELTVAVRKQERAPTTSSFAPSDSDRECDEN